MRTLAIVLLLFLGQQMLSHAQHVNISNYNGHNNVHNAVFGDPGNTYAPVMLGGVASMQVSGNASVGSTVNDTTITVRLRNSSTGESEEILISLDTNHSFENWQLSTPIGNPGTNNYEVERKIQGQSSFTSISSFTITYVKSLKIPSITSASLLAADGNSYPYYQLSIAKENGAGTSGFQYQIWNSANNTAVSLWTITDTAKFCYFSSSSTTVKDTFYLKVKLGSTISRSPYSVNQQLQAWSTNNLNFPITTISSFEYWLDNAIAQKKVFSASGMETFYLDSALMFDSLSEGLHKFNLRVQNNNGLYSAISTQYFYHGGFTSIPTDSMIRYEYFY